MGRSGRAEGSAMSKRLALDLRGRLRNFRLAPSRGLVPLFEAIINSVHAVDAGGRSGGRITIELIRDAQQEMALGDDGDGSLAPITGFRVRDNGVGFTDENYESFQTSDSSYKLQLGGRGVGRFTWLKAFHNVRIESVYRNSKGELRRRSFSFSVDGLSNEADVAESTEKSEGTLVSLEGLLVEYSSHVPKKLGTLGQRVLDHCLVAIRGAAKPIDVLIHDTEDTFNVSAEIAEALRSAETDEREVIGERFKLTHLRLTSAEVSSHRIAFLANRREVCADSFLPHVKGRLGTNLGDGFWWVTLVESSALDHSVSSERDAFLFPEAPDPLFPQQLSMQRLREALVPVVMERLEPVLAPLRERAKEQVRAFVQNEAPEYRHLLSMRSELVEALPPDLPRERLDLELHKLNYKLEAEVREKGARLARESQIDDAAYDEFLSEANAVGKANLAKYVLQRRMILTLLKSALAKTADGKYELEEAVHKIIFPLKATSDEVPYENLNLWIIDEQLAYHAYLASDKELRSMPVIATTERQRPDIIVFNGAFAFAEETAPFNSIVIVEFKRPARDDYTDDENPVSQVLGYIRRVRDGLAKDRAGRPLNLAAHVPFYCYIVCDITPKLKVSAENANLTLTPDAQGYFGFNSAMRAYVEVISFDKLVSDAERRNRILFDKLNLPKR